MKKVILKDLQNVLPLGYFTPDGSLVKSFNIRPWRMAEERAVGEIREKQQNPMLAPFVSELLSYMLTELGPSDFQQKPSAERRLMLSQMFFSDVMYMYVWMRRESIGPDLLLNIICPYCNSKFEFICDLDEFEVEVPDEELASVDDLKRPVQLKKGLEIDGKKYHEVIVKPSTWMAMEGVNAKSAANDGSIKTKFFTDCIVGVTDYTAMEHFVVTDGVLDSLWKVDIELLVKAINDVSGGIGVNVETKCEQCGKKSIHSLDWNYDNFFSNSSIPSPTKS